MPALTWTDLAAWCGFLRVQAIPVTRQTTRRNYVAAGLRGRRPKAAGIAYVAAVSPGRAFAWTWLPRPSLMVTSSGSGAFAGTAFRFPRLLVAIFRPKDCLRMPRG